MIRSLRGARPVLITLALSLAAPAFAQSADTGTDVRLRALEAEVKALQRQVFPGGDAKYFPPQVSTAQGVTPATGTPATTPVSDLLARMDAVEAQMARLTAQGEENSNRLSKLEARFAASAAETTTPAAANNGATTSSNLSAMTSGASTKPVTTATPAALAPKPATTTPAAAKPTSASAQRLAAVRAIEKPDTSDKGDDEYSYGFRLWDAKFYPEAEQQLKLFMQKYPKHARMSFARNLLGRAYFDEGNPREAASWFLQNYQADKRGDRAPDSLLMLAEAMRQLKDSNRACVALTQFAEDYPQEAAGRLKTQYDATRGGVKCN
ncbi:MAG: tetratricopeptide repeat protein [Proteobacteria bacterium]|nr:tetratricopeptide repeat protein [Pseudomonadota bacterium]